MFSNLKSNLKNVFKKTLNEENMDATLEELKIILIKADVGVEVAEKVISLIKKELAGTKVGLFKKKKTLYNALRNSIRQILTVAEPIDLLEEIRAQMQKKRGPYKILVLGVNGTGKTTTIAKLCHFLQENSLDVIVAGADTFRAGAVEQLANHMKNLNVRLIKGQYGADAASIAYDAVDSAFARKISTVIVDTSGRQVNNKNLINELAKIKRTVEPQLTIFIGDAFAGNDVVYQADVFNKEIGIDCSIITKLDADGNGGAALSITFTTKKPIIFMGVGQAYDDLVPFDLEWLMDKLLSSDLLEK